ncbi:CynX/NimT family MFS transporter [Camelliibacillus cellulosilyticus]
MKISGSSLPETRKDKDMKKKALLVIGLCIASLNLRPAINSIAPLLDSIQADLGISATVASLLTSFPVLFMGLFSPVAAKAGSKWGIERIIASALLIIGVGTIIRLFTHSVSFLLATALITGIGIALLGPLLSGFIKQHFPKHVPSLIAVYTVTLSMGAAFSSALSAPLQKQFHSWQGSLGSWAVIAFVAAIIWYLFVNLHVKKSVNTATDVKTKLPWTNSKAWTLTFSFSLMAMLFYSLTAWLPQIIQGIGYTKSYAETSFTIFVAVQIPVNLVLPILLKRLPSRRFWLVTGSLLEVTGLILLMINVEPWIASAFIGIGAGGLFPLNLLLPIDATNNAHDAASWSAMVQSAGYVIGAFGPIILGWIHDASKGFTFAFLG